MIKTSLIIVCLFLFGCTASQSLPGEVLDRFIPDTSTPTPSISVTNTQESNKLSPSATHSITSPPSTIQPTPVGTSVPTISLEVLPGRSRDISQRAIQELAGRLQVSPESILIVKIYPDEFPASNLGCPLETGEPLPLPAIVSGQTIVLEHEDMHYIYHARASDVIFCGTE